MRNKKNANKLIKNKEIKLKKNVNMKKKIFTNKMKN